MPSSLVQAFIVLLWAISASANLSWEDTATPTNARHLKLGRRHGSNQLKPRDSPSCIPHTGFINVTSTDPDVNGYLAVPPSDNHGVYGTVTNTTADALRIFFCAGNNWFDIVALNGAFQASGFPSIGAVQNSAISTHTRTLDRPLPIYASITGTQRGVQGPPKPANHTHTDSVLSIAPDRSVNVLSTMWTIDNTNSFLPHWEQADGSPIPVTLAHENLLLTTGPIFKLVRLWERYAALGQTEKSVIVGFSFVPEERSLS